MLVDQHEAARIAQPRHGRHGIDAFECGDHGAVGEGQLVFLLERIRPRSSSCTVISFAVTEVILAFVIHLMCRSRSSDSMSPLLSPTPP